jgi:hypothetical protein
VPSEPKGGSLKICKRSFHEPDALLWVVLVFSVLTWVYLNVWKPCGFLDYISFPKSSHFPELFPVHTIFRSAGFLPVIFVAQTRALPTTSDLFRCNAQRMAIGGAYWRFVVPANERLVLFGGGLLVTRSHQERQFCSGFLIGAIF